MFKINLLNNCNLNRTIIVLALVLVASCSSIQRNITLDHDKKIKNAYNYLMDKNLIDKRIIVSDTIVNINISDFTTVLSKNKSKQEESKIYDSLHIISGKVNYKKYQYPLKRELNNFNKNRKDNFKIHFTKPTKDYLMVEVFDMNECYGRTNYETTYYLGYSKKYLIYFKGNKVEKYYFIPWRYN